MRHLPSNSASILDIEMIKQQCGFGSAMCDWADNVEVGQLCLVWVRSGQLCGMMHWDRAVMWDVGSIYMQLNFRNLDGGTESDLWSPRCNDGVLAGMSRVIFGWNDRIWILVFPDPARLGRSRIAHIRCRWPLQHARPLDGDRYTSQLQTDYYKTCSQDVALDPSTDLCFYHKCIMADNICSGLASRSNNRVITTLIRAVSQSTF